MEKKCSTNLNVSASEFIPKCLPEPSCNLIDDTIQAFQFVFSDPESFPFPLDSLLPYFEYLNNDLVFHYFVENIINLCTCQNNIQYIGSKCCHYLYSTINYYTSDGNNFIRLLIAKCQKRCEELELDLSENSKLFYNFSFFISELMNNMEDESQKTFTCATISIFKILLKSCTVESIKNVADLLKLTWNRLETEQKNFMNEYYMEIQSLLSSDDVPRDVKLILMTIWRNRNEHLTFLKERLAETQQLEVTMTGMALTDQSHMNSGNITYNNGEDSQFYNLQYKCGDEPGYEQFETEDGTHYFYDYFPPPTNISINSPDSGDANGGETEDEMLKDYVQFVLEEEGVMDPEAEGDYDEYLKNNLLR